MKDNDTISKGFKMTGFCLLPEEWKVVKLGDVSKVSSGGSAPQGDEYFDGENPFVRVQHIDRANDTIIKWDLITDDAVRKYKLKLYPKGVIVFPKSGASIYLEKRAKLPMDAYIVSHLCAVVSNNLLLSQDFLFYKLKFIKLSKDKADGYPTLNLSEIKDTKISFPPLPEQKKIAMVLSAVQKAKEKTEVVIGAARELKKSLMKYLFTYGPVPTEEAEDIRLKETEIGLIPGDWRIVRLGSIADFKNGINFTRNQKGKLGILTIDVLNMYGERIYVSLNNLYRVNKEVNEDYLLRNGDILFVRSSLKREGVGWTSLFKETQKPVTFCGFIIRARLKSNNISPEFLANYLRTSNARENLIASSGKVAITNINQGMLGRILIPLPSFLTQQKIVEILSAVDKKIEAEENKRKTLEELFKTVLNNLMTARIRVNHLRIAV